MLAKDIARHEEILLKRMLMLILNARRTYSRKFGFLRHRSKLVNKETDMEIYYRIKGLLTVNPDPYTGF